MTDYCALSNAKNQAPWFWPYIAHLPSANEVKASTLRNHQGRLRRRRSLSTVSLTEKLFTYFLGGFKRKHPAVIQKKSNNKRPKMKSSEISSKMNNLLSDLWRRRRLKNPLQACPLANWFLLWQFCKCVWASWQQRQPLLQLWGLSVERVTLILFGDKRGRSGNRHWSRARVGLIEEGDRA